VLETRALADGGWEVVTPTAPSRRVLINAAGLWAREVGLLAGVALPVQPMEHHYLITEAIPEIEAHGKEIAVTVDYEGNAYTRQEGKGLLLGTYESNCVPWSVKGTPLDFGHELLQPDLDRVAERLEVAFDRMPALGRAGSRTSSTAPSPSGPTAIPDRTGAGPQELLGRRRRHGRFLPGRRRRALHGGMADPGRAQHRCLGMDVARFGEYATFDYGTTKSMENYSRRFIITYPNEELPAARPRKTTALYDRLKARGAVLASILHSSMRSGSPPPPPAKEKPSFRRSNAFPYVAEEVRAVREAVGVIEIANYAKHE
jgi:Glycine/D-amino acid oxidases (deaminating)